MVLRLVLKNKYDWFIVLVILYSITTLVQSLLPFSFNRIIVLLVAILLFSEFKVRRLKAIVLLYLISFFCMSCLISNDIVVNVNNFIYFAVALIHLCLFADQSSWECLLHAFDKKRKLIKRVAYIDFAVILIAFLSPSCYVQHWGEGMYLIGFTESGHAMAASTCLALSMLVAVFYNQKFKLVHFLMIGFEVLVILRTGARVFLIPLLILLYFFIKNQINNKKMRRFIYFGGVAIFGFVLFRSNMMDKFLYAINNPYNNLDFFYSFTSGRSTFWYVDLKDFLESNIINQFFGHGFSYIYKLNLEKAGMEIWAHNDFINILIAGGILGLIIYVWVLCKMLRTACLNVNKITSICILLYILFPAFMNGYYSYYHFFASSFFMILAIKKERMG